VPADSTSSSTDGCAPFPRATIVITTATPMIIPRIVRKVRSVWRRNARTPMTTLLITFTGDLLLDTQHSHHRSVDGLRAVPAPRRIM
jgi:hypothetical protein